MSVSNLQIEKSSIRYLLDFLKTEVKRELNCHAIGTIITFDSTTATATVAFNYKKVLNQRNAVDTKTYTDVIVDYPVLVRCPIIVVGGGGGYTTYPIFSGDQCLIMFCDRDIDSWLELGNTNSAPDSQRMHDLSDAVVLVGLNSVAKPIPNYSTTSIMTVFGQVVMSFTNLIASLIDSTGQRLCQSGFLQPYAGSSAPSGWLLCYGQAVSRSTYSTLFAIVGTTYGIGDGSTTFNVPDMRGRTVAGLDNMGGSDANVLTAAYNPNRNTLGGDTGEEAHQLNVAELAAHQHLEWFASTGGAGFGTFEEGAGTPNTTPPNGDVGAFFGRSGTTGSSLGHQTVQPTLMINWIIKI